MGGAEKESLVLNDHLLQNFRHLHLPTFPAILYSSILGHVRLCIIGASENKPCIDEFAVNFLHW